MVLSMKLLNVFQKKTFLLFLILTIVLLIFGFYVYLSHFVPLKNKAIELEQLPRYLEHYYANWHEQTEQKQKVLQELKQIIANYQNQVNQSSLEIEKKNFEFHAFRQIQDLLYEFQDAHVSLDLQKEERHRSLTDEQKVVLRSQIEIEYSNLTLKNKRV